MAGRGQWRVNGRGRGGNGNQMRQPAWGQENQEDFPSLQPPPRRADLCNSERQTQNSVWTAHQRAPLLNGSWRQQQGRPPLSRPTEKPLQQQQNGPWRSQQQAQQQGGPPPKRPTERPPQQQLNGQQRPQQPAQLQAAPAPSRPTERPAQQQLNGQWRPQQPLQQQAALAPSAPAASVPAAGPSAPAGEESVRVETKGYQAKFPQKRGPGTKGRPMSVETNHMGIEVRDKQMVIMHYDVDIKLISDKGDGALKECPKKYLKPAVVAFGRIAWNGKFPAFDGKKNLYSNGDLPFGAGPFCHDVSVENPERCQENGSPEIAKLRVTVKKVNSISLKEIGMYFQKDKPLPYPANAVQALDIVLRNSGNSRMLQVGRNFFTPPSGRVISLGNGMDLWYGVFQSAVLGSGNVYFNVDVAHKGFPKAQPVAELVADLGTQQSRNNQPSKRFDVYSWEPRDCDTTLVASVAKYLQGLRVEYEIPGIANSRRVYRFVNLVRCARDQEFKFELPNGSKRNITVEQYFNQEKRYRIRHPLWPCLHVGSKDRQIYVPLELCKVAPKQATLRKLDDEQTRVMVKNAATRPAERKAKILNAFNSLRLSEDPCLREFGIRVSDTMLKVDGRILDPPSLQYKSSNEVRVQRGEWKIDNQKFQKSGIPINNWAIVDLCNLNGMKEDLAVRLLETGNTLGVQFLNKPQMLCPPFRINNLNSLDRFLTDGVASKKCWDLVFVIMPEYIGGASPYGSVKQALELKHNILTQCIKKRTVEKLSQATVVNILLKINAKTNGVNHSIHYKCRPRCFERPIMIMGADVTHPPPDSKNCPSIAAVTASHDPNALFQYNMQWRLQPPAVETILDLEEITLQHLRFFADKTSRTTNNPLPERIIFYRDGVSDGQFETVLQRELQAIRRAVRRMNPGYDPKITFLVVQKRHHTRFFPNPQDRNADRNGNVPPGFVVDTTITHPRDMDFYLVSHQAIQGTARPTKYKVLWDDAQMTEDEIEELTYYLCHLFSRCNRSVSYPAPTYYAHLAAFRAKYYIEGKDIRVDDERKLMEQSLALNSAMVEFNKKHPMFFV